MYIWHAGAAGLQHAIGTSKANLCSCKQASALYAVNLQSRGPLLNGWKANGCTVDMYCSSRNLSGLNTSAVGPHMSGSR